MILADALSRRYGDRLAIREVSFKARPGEILGFLGPNGAGKTTTMRILTGFLAPTSGRASVADFDVVDQPLEAKRRLGYLPETLPLYDDLTAREYLGFVARLKGVDRRKIGDAIDRAMTLCGITDVADRLIRNLSRGYRQRVGLAQAIVHDPPVLILDEPTSAMDPRQIVEIRNVIKGLRGSHTIILSTHILPEATAVCDRVIIINEGRVVAVDTYEQLAARLRRSEKTLVRVARPDGRLTGRLAALRGAVHVTPGEGTGEVIVEAGLGADLREEIARTVVEAGAGLLELRPLAMSLEDVFLRLVTHEEAAEAPRA
ncbi:MAG: ABC transporter ATP-binding protein [Bacillati bacterium ANGP1]|uniref:ABC transporter ATP-binding protein n=1 Tax=Candidatus Segetimicrobium genomatis TaxID=2569760 RepID=A0A537K5D2_9BACT|nr:MAG: ABC transporter ATP-binding protein [Terrabacteria group bacterium ANGP1]